MVLIFLFLITLLAELSITYHQNDYTIKHHRIELIYRNPKYGNGNVSLVPFNRTARAISAKFDLFIDLVDSIPITFQAYKFSSNEYRLFPLFLPTDFCKMQSMNVFGTLDIAGHSNLINCPLKKGHYSIDKYRPDESKFPPHLVNGDFKVAVNVSYDSEKIAEFHWYGAIKPIEKLWN